MTEPPPVADPSELPNIAARVLLVEDNLVNIEVARAILESSGMVMTVATSGSEAVALARAERFDLILMDLQLPDFDGFEAARAIRAGKTPGTRTPIVAMPGTVYADLTQRCDDAGIDGFAEKPLTTELLRRLASRWLTAPMPTEPDPPRGLSPDGLAGLFRESAARLIADLQRAQAAGDRDGVMRAAHTLKSISARVAAGQLNRLGADLEAVARDGLARDLGPAVARVLAAYAALDPSLRGEPIAGPRETAVAPPASPSALRVLVVDDEENERFLVRRALEQAGYRVDECDCGRAAVDYCRNCRPDAVLLDGLMPGMDGIATCRALRADCPPEDVLIVMFTGLDDPAWRARALQAGADRVIEKSVDNRELVGDLRAALAERGLAARG